MPDTIELRVRAVNTAVDSDNKIHDDSVAAAYGFRGGLVPGVTVYGYLAAAVIEHFGDAWLEHGAMDVRFHQPVYDGDDVVVTVGPEANGRIHVEAGACASGVAWLGAFPLAGDYAERPLDRQPPASHDSLAPGTVLGTLVRRFDLAGSRLNEPLDPAQPAVLLGLANELLVRNVVLGPWIHVSSEVRNFSSAKDGEEVRVRGRVEDRYERKGHEFVVLDIVILGEGNRPIEHVRHTAIWRPRAPR